MRQPSPQRATLAAEMTLRTGSPVATIINVRDGSAYRKPTAKAEELDETSKTSRVRTPSPPAFGLAPPEFVAALGDVSR